MAYADANSSGRAALENWLSSDLAATPKQCVGFYTHHPRYSSMRHGNSGFIDPIWDLLADDDRVRFVLNAHDHGYERFAPMDRHGRFDLSGLRSFTVGTGGVSHYDLSTLKANSEVLVLGSGGYANTDAYGVLVIDLLDDGFVWEMKTVGLGTVDEGYDSWPCTP